MTKTTGQKIVQEYHTEGGLAEVCDDAIATAIARQMEADARFVESFATQDCNLGDFCRELAKAMRQRAI